MYVYTSCHLINLRFPLSTHFAIDIEKEKEKDMEKKANVNRT